MRSPSGTAQLVRTRRRPRWQPVPSRPSPAQRGNTTTGDTHVHRSFRDHIEQIWNKGDASAIQRFIAPNYLGVDPAEPEPISGVEGYRQHFARLTTAFPDTHITIDHIIGVNDQVAARLTVEGTHTGDFGGIPPTGRPVRVTIIAIVRITRGQIVVEHANSDALGLLEQLGVIEDPPKVPALLF